MDLKKDYQNAIEKILLKNEINYKKELLSKVTYNNEEVGKGFLDFLIDNKIVVEIKNGDKFRRANMEQIYNYLKSENKKLGLLINIGAKEIKFKRILSIK